MERSKNNGPKIRLGIIGIVILLIIASFILIIPDSVSAATEGDFNYSVFEGNATITGYIGPGGAVNIPSTLGGCPVTTIGSGAFYQNKVVTSVVIPDGVTTIIGYAFEQCSLTSVTIPGSVTMIGNGAFVFSGLTSVTVPDSVTNFGEMVFGGCSALQTAVIGNGVTAYYSTFTNCKNLTSVTFGSGLKTIGLSSFYGCSALTSVTIPSSVTSIGDSAFMNSGLTSVTVPDSVTTVGNMAFSGCKALAYAYIGSGVSGLGQMLFEQSTALTSIDVSSDNLNYKGVGGVLYNKAGTLLIACPAGYSGSLDIPGGVTTIGGMAFYKCFKLTAVTMPSSVTTLGYQLFDGCDNLTSITFLGLAKPTSVSETWVYGAPSTLRGHAYYSSNFPAPGESFFGLIMGDHIPEYTYTITDGKATITSYIGPGGAAKIPSTLGGSPVIAIGDYSFMNNGNITSLTIPDSVQTIGLAAFYRCSALEYITIGNGVTTISKYAFQSCSALTSITIPDSVTYIGNGAFYGSALTSITIPDNVTFLGDGAFYHCEDLVSANIGDGVTIIGHDAFYFCQSLTSITLGGGVTSIKPYAFQYCTSLSSIVLPDSLTSIGYYAFDFCYALTSITIPGNVTSLGSNAFTHCTSLSSATIPDSLTIISDYAFYRCYSLASVSIGSEVTSIGRFAFYFCESLTSITLPDGVTAIGDNAFGVCRNLTSMTFHGLIAPTTVSANWITGANANIRGHAYYSSNFPLEGESFYGLTMGDYIPEFTYTVTSGKVTITGYIGPGGAVKIPPTLGGFPVVAIGASSFQYNTNITSLTIHDNVTSIGNFAFFRCSALTSVTIGNGVASIGDDAFADCSALTSVTFGNSVSIIGTEAFRYCPGLTSITIPDSVTSIGSSAFSDCTSLSSINIGSGVTVIHDFAFASCAATTITLPDSVTTIGWDVFASCYGLTSVTFGSGLTTIGGEVFYDCYSLLSVTFLGLKAPTSVDEYWLGHAPSAARGHAYHSSNFPVMGSSFNGLIMGSYIPFDYTFTFDGSQVTITGYTGSGGAISIPSQIGGYPVATIGDYAFDHCSVVTSVIIPDSVVTIGYAAFQYCTALTHVTVGGGVNVIGNYAFFNCGLTSIDLPDGLTSIGASTFYYCKNLTSVAIPDSVTSIGSRAFGMCYGLTSIIIPNNLTTISADTFRYCKNLISVTIGSNITTIGSDAFSNCYALTSIDIPENVTSIGNGAFEHCIGLTTITFGDGVITIGESAFSYCESLSSVIIGRGVTSIGDFAFTMCYSLTSVIIPSNTTSIGARPFGKCSSLIEIIVDPDNPNYASADGVLYNNGLTNLIEYPEGKPGPFTIPDSVTSIGDSSFSYSIALTSLTIPEGVTSIGAGAFLESRLTSVTIGNGVNSIGDSAFNFCRNLTSVSIGSGVTSIGRSAFSQCPILTSITFYGLSSPTVGLYWISGATESLRGHAYHSSNFPAMDSAFNGLIMGSYIPFDYVFTFDGSQVTITGYTGSGGAISIPSQIGGYPVLAIGNYAFANSSTLTSVTIPDSIISIGEGSFYRCTKLASVMIGDGVTSIGTSAFNRCSVLTSVTMGNGVINIGYGAFASCRYLTSINIPDGVTNIGDYAFSGCAITSVIIPNGVTKVGNNTFGSCIYLDSLTINGVITSIGAYAFSNCALTTFTIPDSVTSIGEYAFYGCNRLTSLNIGTGITSISGNAFASCTSLTSVELPGSVTSIGERAFFHCTGLASITIPGSVTSIGGEALSFCPALTDVAIPNSVTAIGDGAFSHSGLTSVVIPNGVTTISDRTFESCTSLITAIIPYGVTRIGEHAFVSCIGLTSIVIPESVTSIGGAAFHGCEKLTTLTIGSNVESIGNWAFAWCTSLTSVTIPNSVMTIGEDAFYSCGSLYLIFIGSKVTTIGSSAFQSCTALTLINFLGLTAPTSVGPDWILNTPSRISGHAYASSNFPAPGNYFNGLMMGSYIPTDFTFTVSDGKVTILKYIGTGGDVIVPSEIVGFPVVTIGYRAFINNMEVTSVTLPDSITTIGESAFDSCTGLTSVVFGNGVTSIGDWAFFNSGLTSVSLPGSLTSINVGVFQYCSAMTAITFGTGITKIGDWAFADCTAITSVNIPEGVTTIGNYSFTGCEGLATITFSDSVTTINSFAFLGCIDLTSVTIGKNVNSIGIWAFAHCYSLTSVTISDSVIRIGDSAFWSCTSLHAVSIGSGVTTIGNDSFRYCTALTHIAIPDNVAYIAGDAFANCDHLISVDIGRGVTSLGGTAFAWCSALQAVNFYGQTAPFVEGPWDLVGVPFTMRGHAYCSSEFPVPGQKFGIMMMGSYLADVTFSQTGVDTSNAGIVLIVDGASFLASQLPVTFTWYSGTAHSFEWALSVGIDPVTRFGWQSSNGLSTDPSGTISVPDNGGSISSTYATQHQVSFVATGLDGDAGTNTVLTVGITNYAWNALPIDIWVNHGTSFIWSSPVPATGGLLFTLLQHSGLSSPICAEGVETAEYFKALKISGHVYLSGTTTGADDWHLQLWKDGSQIGPDLVTDSSGAYSFTVTLPGTYQVREVLKDGWTETSPVLIYSAGDGSTPSVLGHEVITAISGTDVTGLDIFNFEWLTVAGTKFFDADGDGIKDFGEPGLQYWAISISKDGRAYREAVETNDYGRYSFLIKDPGSYIISEAPKSFWVQTCPIGGGHEFLVSSGTDIPDLDFGNWLGAQARVTTGDICMFDVDGDASNGRQFKLVYTPDVPDFPTKFTLTASNPGQFYFNVFFVGSVKKGDAFFIGLPFPFVTQGDEPVQVYGGLNTNPLGYLVPGTDMGNLFGVSPMTMTWSYDGQYGFGDQTWITLTALNDYSGFLYINTHLDYGLKKNIGELSPNYNNGAVGTVLTIEEGWIYDFSVTGPGDLNAYDEIRNINSFKRNPGFGGLVLDEDGDPVVGAVIEIRLKGVLIGTAVTDDDGWYMLDYKHVGKPTTFTLKLYVDGVLITEITVTVKPASFSMVIFSLSVTPPEPPPPEEPPIRPPKPPKK